MIRPWYRSRLFWIGIVLIPLLSAAWWASEHYPATTTMRQHHRYRELGHRFGGWSYWVVDRPSTFRDLQTPTTFGVGSSLAEWEKLLDSIGFVPSGAEPSFRFRSGPGAGYLPEEPAARAACFPTASWQQGDGWRFRFVPYWLLLPGFLAVWATALWTWQKWKRTRSA
jgi:hypothetical protein